MPRKSDSTQLKALKSTLRKLRMRYAAYINRKNRWAHKAEQTAWSISGLQTTIFELEHKL